MSQRNKIIAGVTAVGGIVLGRKILRAFSKTDISERVILVTGGSRGLGFILTRQLLSKGARVAICARSQEDLSIVSEKFSEYRNQLLTIQCDITDKGQIKKMVKEVTDKMGRIYAVINNAGVMQIGPRENMSEEDFKQAMQVHYWGPFNIINEVLPSMTRSGSGRIVNIVSIGGKVSFPHLLPYNASKFALSGLSEGLTAELAKFKIKVTTVYPGLMRTGSPMNIDVKGQHKKEFGWFKISDSLPGISMNAEKAAKKIINAMEHGDRILTLTLPAKIALAVHGIVPSMNVAAFQLVNKALPDGVSGVSKKKKGFESKSKASESFFTRMTRKAEVLYNEKAHSE